MPFGCVSVAQLYSGGQVGANKLNALSSPVMDD